MPFNLAGLTAYIDQLGSELMVRDILQGQTAKYITVQQGVKKTATISLLDTSIVVQADSCTSEGFSDPSGNTASLTQQNLTVCPLKYNINYCLYGTGGIEDYFLGFLGKAGSYHNEIDQFQKFTLDIVQKWNQSLDGTLWLGGYVPGGSNSHSGDTGSQSFMGSCQGILYNLYNTIASATTVTVTYSGVPTVANVNNIITQIVVNIPDNIRMRKDIIIFCKPQYVEFYKLYLLQNNLFHGFVDDSTSALFGGPSGPEINTLTQRVFGFPNILLVGTPGLAADGFSGNGYQGFVCSYGPNFYMGTDMIDDYENLIRYYSEDFDGLRLVGRMRIGGNVAWPQYTIVY